MSGLQHQVYWNNKGALSGSRKYKINHPGKERRLFSLGRLAEPVGFAFRLAWLDGGARLH